jgi:hypothetical protein
MLFAVSEAANRLGFEQISALISMFIQFGANILLGAVILMIGFWLANLVAQVIGRGEYNSSRWLANLVRILIMGLVIAMGLRAMGIADSIVNLAFGLTLGAVAVAFALAFGLGGRQPAEQVLNDLIDKCKKDAKEPNPLHKENSDQITSEQNSNSVSALAAREFTEHGPETSGQGTNPPANKPSISDQGVPDSLNVNPNQPLQNNPFGSTGEKESDVDINNDKGQNNSGSSDDKK